MGTSQRTSLSLLIGLGGLGAAGCMPHGGGAPGANPPVVAKTELSPTDVPVAGDGAADREQLAVVQSVNDNVTRVSRILNQREEAKQFARDVKEQRESAALRGADHAQESEANPLNEPTAAKNKAKPQVPEEIEAIAAQLRAAAKAAKEGTADASNNADPAPVEDAWANTGLSAAEPHENGDFGDAIPARRVQGSASGAPVEVQRVHAEQTTPAGNIGANPGSTPNTGAGTRGPGIDPLLALQEQYLNRVNDQPKNLAAQLELQLARLLRNEPVPAMADLSTLAGEDRELLAAVSDALSNFRNIVRNDPNPLGSEKARPFIEMADRIRARSDLSVQSVNLCTSVKAFGNYDPIEPMQFAAGSPTLSVFYCEVDGFLSQINDRQQWESKLSLELRLYNEAGMQLWRVAPETVTDVSRKRRRDFFIAKRIQLPSRLTPGAYMLKATIRDLQANRVAESTLQVSVVNK